jgi:hypothetical protein
MIAAQEPRVDPKITGRDPGSLAKKPKQNAKRVKMSNGWWSRCKRCIDLGICSHVEMPRTWQLGKVLFKV